MDISNPFAKKPAAAPSLLSAQQFVNVKDIRDKYLYTKDGLIFAYIKIQPVSIDLLSNREKQTLVRSLSGELSSLGKPFKFFTISRPVDITGLIDEYMELYAVSTEEVQKYLLEQEIKVYKDYARSGEVIERNFYIILWERAADDAEYAIGKRAKDIVYKFRNCGIGADILNTGGILQLCNFFANPSYAHLETVDFGMGIPVLKTEG